MLRTRIRGMVFWYGCTICGEVDEAHGCMLFRVGLGLNLHGAGGGGSQFQHGLSLVNMFADERRSVSEGRGSLVVDLLLPLCMRQVEGAQC